MSACYKMATTAALPTLHTEKTHATSESFEEKGNNSPTDPYVDEKQKSDVVEGVVLDKDDVGAVFESPRLIDLGEDGKERPIGQFPVHVVKL